MTEAFSRIGLFGCGNMGGAMLSGWIAGGLAPERLTVIDPGSPQLPPGVAHVAVTQDMDAQVDLLLLAVKPQLLDAVAADASRVLRPGAVLLSILAGVDCAALALRFPSARIVRLMPNMAVAIGKAPLGLWAADDDAGLRAAIDALVAPLGTPEWLAREADMAAFTALAGSGPAFLYRFIDALAAGGAALGLAPKQAARLALATVEGSAMLAAASDLPPGALADRVASKGGSTREGLDVLDADAALLDLVARTLGAARDRNLSLAAEAAQANRS